MIIRPVPKRSALTEAYWMAAENRQLVIQQCSDCDQYIFPPRSLCPHCWSVGLGWQLVSGRGKVHTFTIVTRPPHPVFEGQCPFVVAVVELEEGARMISNIVECEPDKIEIGMRVVVRFQPIEGGTVLPVFSTVV